MPAGIYHIIVEPGATFKRTITWRNEDGALVDLTDYTATMTISDSYGGAALIALTESAGLTLGGAAGTVDVVITKTQTSALAAGERVWEMVLTDSAGVATRLLRGSALVDPSVKDLS